jgi:DNA-binding PadR family transcriptional regulator
MESPSAEFFLAAPRVQDEPACCDVYITKYNISDMLKYNTLDIFIKEKAHSSEFMPERAFSKATKSNGFDQIMRPQGAPRGLLFLYILHTIAKKPAHGYEIMQDIESKTNGTWRPGAGSLYPLLKKMAARGLIEEGKAEKHVGGRVYSITPDGITCLNEVKKSYSNAGRHWSTMRGIFMELMNPEDLPRYFSDGIRMQSEIAQDLLKSKMDSLPKNEVEYMLKEYLLVLERQIQWANQILSDMKNTK